MKRTIQTLLFALIAITMPIGVLAQTSTIDLSTLTGTYVVNDNEEYIFTGTGSYGIKVESGNSTIVLDNASITVGEGSAIDVASGSNATIFVLGDNTIGTTKTEYSDVPCGGIFVAEGGTVNITSNGTDNILRAHGTLAAAIGGKYIHGSESYNAGSISISNVTVYAYTNNNYAAAIGAAGRGSCGTINITNAVVYAYGAGDRWTSAPGIGSACDHVGWAETIPVVFISGSEIHTFRYNPYSDYIGYLGDEMGEEGGYHATGSINCGEGGSVKSSTIYCYTGLTATTTDKTVKYGALGSLLVEDENGNWVCEGEHTYANGVCANCGYKCTHEGGTVENCHDNGDGTHSLTCSICGEVTEEHTPDESYTANGNVIMVSCSECHGTAGTATITAENTTYNGTAQETATVAYSEGWNSGELTVSYANNTNAGTATASITVGEATASVEFTIAKAEIDGETLINPEFAKGLIYNGTAQALVTKTGSVDGGYIVYSLSIDGEYTTTIPVATEAGNYRVYWTIECDENHYVDGTPGSSRVTIAKANPEYTVPTGLTATYGDTLAKVELPTGWAWNDAESTSVGNAGTRTFKALYNPDSNNYNTVEADVTVEVAKADPEYTVPTGLTATYGNTLADVEIPAGWTWKDAETTSVGNVGTRTFKAVFTPADTVNYNTVEADVTIEVAKALIDIYTDNLINPEFAEGLIYNGTAQALVTNSGSIDGGYIVFSLNPDGEYTTEIPVATEAGEYVVYYRIEGDENHYWEGSSAFEAVTIAKAASSITTAPSGKELTYKGYAQALVTAGEAMGGTILYSLDNATWNEEIPVGKEIGDYTVYYKVIGDNNHDDIATQSVTVAIKACEHSYNEDGFCEMCSTANPDETMFFIFDGDHKAFNVAEDLVGVNIEYTRGLHNTEWNSIYLPFEVPVTEGLLDEFEFAYVNDMHSADTDDNGEIDEIEMEIVKIKTGTLHANHPYFIRAKSEYTILQLSCENTTLHATEETTLNCSSIYMDYAIVGSYKHIKGTEFASMPADRYYAISIDGGWWQIPEDASLYPFRAYLSMTARDGSPVKVSDEAMRSIRIREKGEGTTDIEEVKGENGEVNSEIYDLSGRRVMLPQKGGVYIVGGKKIVY